MKTLDYLGLNVEKSKRTIKELHQLLADMHVFYMNMRGLHWHIQGPQFFVLHEQFEEIYDGLEGELDQMAERILTLGDQPKHTFSSYLKLSNVKETDIIHDDKEAIKAALDGLKVVIAQMRKVADEADDADDEVTEDMMVGLLGGHEKKVWMLVSYLK